MNVIVLTDKQFLHLLRVLTASYAAYEAGIHPLMPKRKGGGEGETKAKIRHARANEEIFRLSKAVDTELIPHPDTVRLDWLADRDQHIGNVQLPAECVTCNLHSMRDAIDMAMQMDKENTGTQEKDV